MEEKKTRKRRTAEELIAEIEGKIEAENKRHDAAIKKFQEQIKKLKQPKKSKLTKAQKEKKILEALRKKYSVSELAEKLGESVPELLGEQENTQKAFDCGNE